MSQFIPHSHFPYKDEEKGQYSEYHKAAIDIQRAGMTLALKALEKVSYHEHDRFRICDYGTADGGTSMPLMKEIIAALRNKYGNKLPIEVIYEDQPVNDFNSVFLRMHNLIPGAETSFLRTYENVFVYCCGTNFYEQCFPSESISFGVSFTAVQWLSKNPCSIENDIVCYGEHATEDEVNRFKEQARQDLERMLVCRAKELKPGGRLLVSVLYRDENSWDKTGYDLVGTFTLIWKQMVKEGKVTEREFINTNLNIYIRTEEECLAAFDGHSSVSKSGLVLCGTETKFVKCHFHQKWMQEGIKDDVEAKQKHGKAFVKMFRTWGNSTFYKALSTERSEEERIALVNELYERYANLVAENPEDYSQNLTVLYMDIKKD